MAKMILLVDDLDGTQDDVQSVEIKLDDEHVRLDLSAKNRLKLEAALRPFLSKGEEIQPHKPRLFYDTPSGKPKAKSDPEQLAAIRRWANKNGYEVSEKGRIPRHVVAAYEANN